MQSNQAADLLCNIHHSSFIQHYVFIVSFAFGLHKLIKIRRNKTHTHTHALKHAHSRRHAHTHTDLESEYCKKSNIVKVLSNFFSYSFHSPARFSFDNVHKNPVHTVKYALSNPDYTENRNQTVISNNSIYIFT